ncbi:MAG: hypothetical protein K6G33_10825 [Ruminococcus sp.]|uniref:hypothetical protein n=1 Tax=Ruminococcus sp. TaxID=41978 RepID=UPI0025DC6EAA|nr:hypothetical protein [Ruminococcus sp.]MCR5601218.1 hypothetical protein [Ruminococcus sp.]
MMRIVSICVLSIIGAVFVFGIIGYFIFLRRIKEKKTAIKLKRRLKKNAVWWTCCWTVWLVVGFLEWNGARAMNDRYHMINYGLLFIGLILITILLALDFFIGKFAYITSQRVYFPDNFGLARKKKKVMYKVSGDTLKLWFNNAIMPKEFTIIEKNDELVKLLKDNYKLNKGI